MQSESATPAPGPGHAEEAQDASRLALAASRQSGERIEKRLLPKSSTLLKVLDSEPDLMRLLCRVYAQDFVCFGYDIPPACRDLFPSIASTPSKASTPASDRSPSTPLAGSSLLTPHITSSPFSLPAAALPSHVVGTAMLHRVLGALVVVGALAFIARRLRVCRSMLRGVRGYGSGAQAERSGMCDRRATR